MRRALFIVVAVSGWAMAAAPVISPSTPTVYVSSTMQFVADQTVTWSMYPGSTGTISAGGLYSAPASMIAHQSHHGWALLPNDSIYNTRVDSCPINTSTNTYFHNNTNNDKVSIEVDMPENIYTNQTNSVTMTFQYSPENNGSFPMNGISSMTVENGLFSDEFQVDQHIMGLNKDTGQMSELYKYFKYNTDTSYPNTNSRSGLKYNYDYDTGHGVDAAGMKITPLIDRYEELVMCRDYGIPIKHAGRVTLPIGYLAPGVIWPGTQFATDAGEIPFAARMRMKASVNISTYSASLQCILNQWKHYGAFTNDGGQSMHFQFAADSIGDYTLFNAIANELAGSQITANDFEYIDESSLQDTVPNSKTYHSERVATNTYVTADGFAIVVASNTTTHQISYMPILLRPVTIGTDRPVGYSFLAGAPATQLPINISGAPNDPTYSCTMSPSTGTLSRGGIYTPPAAVLTRTSTTITCVSHQDPAVWTKFPVFVYASTGARVSYSNASESDYGPDVNGNKWYGDRGSFWRLQGHANCDWTGDSGWGSVTDSGLYKHCEYIGGGGGNGDIMGRYIVANGSYSVNLKVSIGQPDFSRGTWQAVFDSNGQIFSSTYTSVYVGTGPFQALGLTANVADYYDVIGNGHSDTPGQISMTRQVSDNNIYYAVRHLTPYNITQPASAITAAEVALIALDTSVSSPTLTLSNTGSGIDEIITVISSNSTGGQFKLVFEAADNWGLSQWYDLVNDANSQTNLALAYSVNGPANMCNRENGLGNLTFYGKNDNKYNIFEASCTYSAQARSMTIVRNTPTLVILEATGYGMSASPTIDTNTLVTVDYYIYPNGQIYIHDNITVSDPWDFTAGGTQNNYFMEFALNNPGATGSVTPDSGVGWIRASYSQNPYDYFSGQDRYVYAYWDGSTIGYSTFTKASILAVPSPNNTAGLIAGQIQHNWSCGTGCGTTRWGYSFTSSSSSVLNMSAGASLSWDWMIQLGSQGSQYLPDLSSQSVCDPIATAYINNPTPNVPDIATSTPTKGLNFGRGKLRGGGRFK